MRLTEMITKKTCYPMINEQVISSYSKMWQRISCMVRGNKGGDRG